MLEYASKSTQIPHFEKVLLGKYKKAGYDIDRYYQYTAINENGGEIRCAKK
jgi:hypothetical protein